MNDQSTIKTTESDNFETVGTGFYSGRTLGLRLPHAVRVAVPYFADGRAGAPVSFLNREHLEHRGWGWASRTTKESSVEATRLADQQS